MEQHWCGANHWQLGVPGASDDVCGTMGEEAMEVGGTRILDALEPNT